MLGCLAFISIALSSLSCNLLSSGANCVCPEGIEGVCVDGSCQPQRQNRDVGRDAKTPELDLSPIDLSPIDAKNCRQSVKIGELKTEWATPNSIAWSWIPPENASDFGFYELHVATSRSDLELGRDVKIYNVATNPSLGFYDRPRQGELKPVDYVVTIGHESSTLYFGKLLAFSGSSCATPTNVAGITTGPEPDLAGGPIDVFNETKDFNYSWPECVVSLNDHATYTPYCQEMGGSATCEPLADTSKAEKTCWENVRIGNDSLDFGLLKGHFDNAFVEFELSIGKGSHSYYASAIIETEIHFRLVPITYIADGAYHRYQFKLSSMSRDGIFLNEQRLLDAKEFRFGVGSPC